MRTKSKAHPTASDRYLAHVTRMICRRLEAQKPLREIATELDLNTFFVSRIRRKWLADKRRPQPRGFAIFHRGEARRCPGCGGLLTTSELCVKCQGREPGYVVR